jgi:hypothetical protein
VLFEGIIDRDEVLERFGHFEALNMQVARVEEVVDPLPAVVEGLGQ